jgi:hypothetical protein
LARHSFKRHTNDSPTPHLPLTNEGSNPSASAIELVRKRLELKNCSNADLYRPEDISERSVSAVAYPVEVLLFPQPVIKTALSRNS